jgi:hypothetical protein
LRRELGFNQGVEPPSRIAGDMVIAVGVKGLLLDSHLAKNGTKLVLFDQ